MQTRNVLRIALVTAFVLLLPLVAMQFTDEVAWSPADFVFLFATAHRCRHAW